jgi:hypothetical protein
MMERVDLRNKRLRQTKRSEILKSQVHQILPTLKRIMERADTNIQKILPVIDMTEVEELNESIHFHPKVTIILGTVGVNIANKGIHIHLKILIVTGMIEVERVCKSMRGNTAEKDILILMRRILVLLIII